MPDAIFDDPRLARVYDPLDPDRSDLDVYVALADELGVRSVLDIGCGTGTFACMLARRGLEVTGVDPAAAMLEVACSKPGADAVQWVQRDRVRRDPGPLGGSEHEHPDPGRARSPDPGGTDLRRLTSRVCTGGHRFPGWPPVFVPRPAQSVVLDIEPRRSIRRR